MWENKHNYYLSGIKRLLYNQKVFWLWIIGGVAQALLIAYICLYSVQYNFSGKNGKNVDLWVCGTMIFGICIVIVNLKVLIISYQHSFGSLFFIFGSMAIYLVTMVVLNYMSSSDTHLLFSRTIKNVNYHIGNILILGITSCIDFSLELNRRMAQKLEYAKQEKKYQ